jgi:radical SAM superfamily enzyme YgiQ (UPF0313 family)
VTPKKKDSEKANINSWKCNSASRVTRYASRVGFSFKGSWLINYDPKESKYPEILLDLAQIQDYFTGKNTNFNAINIIFNKKATKNYYFKENNEILLSFCDKNAGYEEKGTKPCDPAIIKPLEKAIKTVSLLFPRLENDQRWKTMGLPAGHLFLTASLRDKGFAAMPMTLTFPGENPPPEALSSDLAGMTLFEDLLPLLRPFLAVFRASYRGILAAGGPFPTLAPLAAVYNLPQVNLFVRGEAERALPAIVQALNLGDDRALFAEKGLFWKQPGVIAMSGFDQVNRPEDLGALAVNLDFLRPAELEKGLEMNFSRGCRRGCVFCCRAQGTKFRILPLGKVQELLEKYNVIAENTGRDDRAPTHSRYTININDDDILQDPDYAREIFALVRKNGLRIFGIQTSTASLVDSHGSPEVGILDMVSEKGLFAEDRPLLWLGTDTFLPARARRLGKKLPSRDKFPELLREIEKRGLRHFHYWISSDGDSNWEEFVEELSLIFGFFRDYPGFGVLAHAPFIVPYPSSRLFGTLEFNDPRLKIKLALDAPDSRFAYRVIDRLETHWPQLNNLLRNEKAGGEFGFFELLKAKNFIAAAQLVYYFLKQEKLQNSLNDPGLQMAQGKLEELLGELIRTKAL